MFSCFERDHATEGIVSAARRLRHHRQRHGRLRTDAAVAQNIICSHFVSNRVVIRSTFEKGMIRMKKMRDVIARPLEETLNAAWQSFPVEYKRALAIILMVNLAAFGFQMANLSLHHDDVSQFFRNDGRLGHQLGRYGYSWLHHYVQGSLHLPFLQLLEGILLTTTYALVVAHAFGLRKTIDVVFVGSIVSIYPYMAQLYQYDTAVFPFAFAHLLAGLAALLSLKYRLGGFAAAALLYVSAFAIYQSVLSNALAVIVFATIFRLV